MSKRKVVAGRGCLGAPGVGPVLEFPNDVEHGLRWLEKERLALILLPITDLQVQRESLQHILQSILPLQGVQERTLQSFQNSISFWAAFIRLDL